MNIESNLIHFQKRFSVHTTFYMLSSRDKIKICRFYLGNLLIYVTHYHTLFFVMWYLICDLIYNSVFASAVMVCFKKKWPQNMYCRQKTKKCFVKYSYMKLQSAIQNRYSVIPHSFIHAGGCRKLLRITAMCARCLTLSGLSASAFHAIQ